VPGVATKQEPPAISQEEREATADFDAAGNGDGGYPAGEVDDEKPRTLEDIEAVGAEIAEEPDGQLFVVEEGERVTLSSLYKRGTPVEYEFKVTGKSVKGQGGLISLDQTNVMLVLRCVPGKVEIDPTRDSDGRIEKVKIRANLKPAAVYKADSEAARVALSGE
jgi:hypothetical protein